MIANVDRPLRHPQDEARARLCSLATPSFSALRPTGNFLIRLLRAPGVRLGQGDHRLHRPAPLPAPVVVRSSLAARASLLWRHPPSAILGNRAAWRNSTLADPISSRSGRIERSTLLAPPCQRRTPRFFIDGREYHRRSDARLCFSTIVLLPPVSAPRAATQAARTD